VSEATRILDSAWRFRSTGPLRSHRNILPTGAPVRKLYPQQGTGTMTNTEAHMKNGGTGDWSSKRTAG